jgi:hypothetical protein
MSTGHFLIAYYAVIFLFVIGIGLVTALTVMWWRN